MDIPRKEPAFSPKSGKLIPCGKLKPHLMKVEFMDGCPAIPTCIWIDEAGILWNISSRTNPRDLNPYEWPRDIRAKYIIGYKSLFYKGSKPVVADNYKSAKEQIIKSLTEEKRYANDMDFTLISCLKADS